MTNNYTYRLEIGRQCRDKWYLRDRSSANVCVERMCLADDEELSRNVTVVCRMSSRTQLAKCALCVVLCLITSAILLNVGNCFRDFRTCEMKNSVATKETVSVSKRVDAFAPRTNGARLQIHNASARDLHSDKMNKGSFHSQIATVCARYDRRSPLIETHFLYNPYHGSLYCWIRKAASSTFTKLFSGMRSRRIIRDYYKEINILAPRSLAELEYLVGQEEIFKLLVVRHPFERIVSSYRDRIEDNTKYTDQAWIYAKKIFRITRPNIFHSNASASSLQTIFTPDRRLRLVPTFKEFAEWLIQTPPADDDVHWVSYHTHCAPCRIHYDFVLKIDDYTFNDISYLLPRLGTNTTAAYLPKLQTSRGGPTDFRRTCRYIGTLERTTIIRLHERYKIDFEMYNYSTDRYIDCIGRYR